MLMVIKYLLFEDALQVLTDLIFPASLWGRRHYCLNCIDDEAGTQGGAVYLFQVT